MTTKAVWETVTGTASYVAIKSSPFPFKGELTAHPSNGGDILMKLGASGQVIHIPAGTIKYCYNPTDLSQFLIEGNGYVLILDGNTDPGW